MFTSGNIAGGGVCDGVGTSVANGDNDSAIFSGFGDIAIGVGICGVVAQVGDGECDGNRNWLLNAGGERGMASGDVNSGDLCE